MNRLSTLVLLSFFFFTPFFSYLLKHWMKNTMFLYTVMSEEDWYMQVLSDAFRCLTPASKAPSKAPGGFTSGRIASVSHLLDISSNLSPFQISSSTLDFTGAAADGWTELGHTSYSFAYFQVIWMAFKQRNCFKWRCLDLALCDEFYCRTWYWIKDKGRAFSLSNFSWRRWLMFSGLQCYNLLTLYLTCY